MQFTDNGNFALIRTYDSGNNKTYVTVIDNETGDVVDAPIEMDGEFLDFDNGTFQTVGTRVYVQTVEDDSNTSKLAIIDTATGTMVTRFSIPSSRGIAQNNVAQTASSGGNLVSVTLDDNTSETLVSVINSQSGVAVGAEPVIISGRPSIITVDEAHDRIYVPVNSDDSLQATVHFVSL